MYAVLVWNILDDERRNRWANTSGSTAEIVVPIRQPIVDRLLGRVAWPRVVEQLYLRLADDNRLELMVVGSMFGFRKRFDLGLRLAPFFDRTAHARITLSLENPGLLSSVLSMAGAALTLPRGISFESGRVVFDLDDVARAAGYGDVSALLKRAEFAVREGVLWVTATLAIPSGTADQAAPAPSAPNPGTAAQAPAVNVRELLPLFAGARATFAVRLAESLVNRMVADGMTLWRTRTGTVPALPKGMDVEIGTLALRFENGTMIMEGSAALSNKEPS